VRPNGLRKIVRDRLERAAQGIYVDEGVKLAHPRVSVRDRGVQPWHSSELPQQIFVHHLSFTLLTPLYDERRHFIDEILHACSLSRYLCNARYVSPAVVESLQH
jgi:hypothetical protein